MKRARTSFFLAPVQSYLGGNVNLLPWDVFEGDSQGRFGNPLAVPGRRVEKVDSVFVREFHDFVRLFLLRASVEPSYQILMKIMLE